MKKLFLNFGLFSIFSIIFYIFALFIWNSLMPRNLKPNLIYKRGAYGYLNTRLKQVKTIKNIDILFLGSSHAYRGFDTRIFEKAGYKCFNLGSSAQTPIQTKVLLRRYFKALNPKIVVYEVYPSTFSIDGIESSLDVIANDKNDIFSLEMVVKLKHIKTLNAFLYSSVRNVLNLDKNFSENQKIDDDTYVSGGFVEKKIKHFNPNPMFESKIKIDQKQLRSFEEVLKIIKVNKTKVILVFAPVSKVLYSSYSNLNEFENKIKKRANYYDFNKIVNLNDSIHFYDSHHLNQEGVNVFNQRLLELLKQKF